MGYGRVWLWSVGEAVNEDGLRITYGCTCEAEVERIALILRRVEALES